MTYKYIYILIYIYIFFYKNIILKIKITIKKFFEKKQLKKKSKHVTWTCVFLNFHVRNSFSRVFISTTNDLLVFTIPVFSIFIT